jgi:hypothetical protein
VPQQCRRHSLFPLMSVFFLVLIDRRLRRFDRVFTSREPVPESL